MAKKKSSNVQGEKPLQKPEDTVKTQKHVTPSMESEGSEKIDQLKSLNQMLLKETVERRQQVDSLVLVKDSMETELARSKKERDELKSELARLGESVAKMEVEKGVVTDFVAVEVGLKGEDAGRRIKGLEMENQGLKSEISRLSEELLKNEGLLGNEREALSRVSLERDGLKNELDVKTEEIRKLKRALSELEEEKGEMVQRLEELRDTYNHTVGEKDELEMRIESIRREKDSVVRSLEGANKLKEKLNDELQRTVREKEVIQEEKNAEMFAREGLENVVSGLNETVARLQKEEERLHGIVAELEKRNCEGEEREKDLRREFDQLVEEKKFSDGKVDRLLVEKTVMDAELGEVIQKLDEQKAKIEGLVKEKVVLGEAKTRLDGELGMLHSQIAELTAVVSKLEECNRVEVGRVKSLECELGEYRRKLEVLKSERDEMENRVHVEKKNSVALEGKIKELESKVEESIKAVEKVKAENAAILAVKAELESERDILNGKIAPLESAVTEARNGFDFMKGKAELANAKTEGVLNMLKETVAFCSKDEDDREEDGDAVSDHKRAYDEEANPCLTELEMIKNAFKSKVIKVENMRRELEFLKNSVEEAHRRKGFWTMLSSATTVLAAVSIAYIARGH